MDRFKSNFFIVFLRMVDYDGQLSEKLLVPFNGEYLFLVDRAERK
jgi:hypothetical protein